MDHYSIGTYLNIVSNSNITNNFGASTNHNVIANSSGKTIFPSYCNLLMDSAIPTNMRVMRYNYPIQMMH